VAVIGAGWAGLSAALQLAEAGRTVALFESHAQPGGRARSLERHGAQLDNGQHILVGACRRVQEQMRRVGVDPAEVLLTLPFGLTLHEAGATPVSIAPRSIRMLPMARALFRTVASEPLPARIRTLSGIARMLYGSRAGDPAVRPWLRSCQQPESLIRSLWEPLCLAVMNTPPDTASAAIFQNVLRQTLLGTPEDAHLLIPRVPLGRLFPEPALARLKQLGAEIRMHSRVTAITCASDGRFRLTLRGSDSPVAADQVILAVAPRAACRLLPKGRETAHTFRQLEALGTRSICTVYLRYRNPPEHLPPLTGLLGQQGQWLLPRSVSGEPHWVAVVISAADEHTGGLQPIRWETVSRELADTFPELGSAEAGLAICERQATIDARTGIDAHRPAPESGIPGLLLAGDYTARGLPSTLEAAVLGGLEAARIALGQVNRCPPVPDSRPVADSAP
jgi:squalene-associated FAD-dependent desaturase